ncbi:MAG: CoA-binding protein, partial [archaeon]|nr:CoA-binding protein [archaeon]
MPPALESAFSARRIAVIGASRNPGKIGYVVLENFVKGGFSGKIFPVNPHAEKILDLKTYSSILKVPGRVDLAIITVPAALVPKVLEECGRKKAGSIVIISAGFSEIGNMELTTQVEKVMEKYPRMPVIGPNCLGILDTRSHVDTLFLPRYRLG